MTDQTIGDYLADERARAYIDAGKTGKQGTCVECGRSEVTIKGRGLCGTCYQAARRGGYLSDYPRSEVYEHEWNEDVLREMLTVHGVVKIREMLDLQIDLFESETQVVRNPKR